jgi:hypothetical protein
MAMLQAGVEGALARLLSGGGAGARAALTDAGVLGALLKELPAGAGAKLVAQLLTGGASGGAGVGREALLAALGKALASMGQAGAGLKAGLPAGVLQLLAGKGAGGAGGTGAAPDAAKGAALPGGDAGQSTAQNTGAPMAARTLDASQAASLRGLVEQSLAGGALSAGGAAAGSSGAGSAEAELALALGGLAALLKASDDDATALLDSALRPLGAHVFVDAEGRGPLGGEGGDGALDLMDAMRSLDFAGLKAVALDRAARRARELREADTGDAAAGRRLSELHRTMAQLLASDPTGIAHFGRERPELFPPLAARQVSAELLLCRDGEAERALMASLVHALQPAVGGGREARAFAAGYLVGALGAAAAAIANTASAQGSAWGARRVSGLVVSAAGLARSLPASPSGPEDRDGPERLLAGRAEALGRAVDAASAAQALSAAERLLPQLETLLVSHVRAQGGGTDLVSEAILGVTTFLGAGA